MVQHFSKHRLDTDTKMYIIEEVKEFVYTLLILEGFATIISVGGNGRFQFLLNSTLYSSTFTKNVCFEKDTFGFHKDDDQYYDYSKVVFDHNIDKEWNELYHSHINNGDYWKEL
jgi:hypothetical protein